ncbi:hypothetical protein CSUI_000333 [Cystoisospora suis]|uniref:Uncharacterized protein n=1 Tax=Cystoisospora suis TaxID=483139 RepID=A0A2C6LFX5_9APIC|nr:hypothetical protein CSUI_000333 [Cystoisospora suis]
MCQISDVFSPRTGVVLNTFPRQWPPCGSVSFWLLAVACIVGSSLDRLCDHPPAETSASLCVMTSRPGFPATLCVIMAANASELPQSSSSRSSRGSDSQPSGPPSPARSAASPGSSSRLPVPSPTAVQSATTLEIPLEGPSGTRRPLTTTHRERIPGGSLPPVTPSLQRPSLTLSPELETLQPPPTPRLRSSSEGSTPQWSSSEGSPPRRSPPLSLPRLRPSPQRLSPQRFSPQRLSPQRSSPQRLSPQRSSLYPSLPRTPSPQWIIFQGFSPQGSRPPTPSPHWSSPERSSPERSPSPASSPSVQRATALLWPTPPVSHFPTPSGGPGPMQPASSIFLAPSVSRGTRVLKYRFPGKPRTPKTPLGRERERLRHHRPASGPEALPGQQSRV